MISKRTTWIYLGLFLLLVFLGLKYAEPVDHYDGLMYYAYLPTLLIDHDLDFANQYTILQCYSWYSTTYTGHLNNYMAIGPAILWSPFFILIHIAILIINLFGFHLPINGNVFPYTLSPLLGNICCFLISLHLIYRWCRKYFSTSISILAISSIILSSFNIFYLIYAPSYSHITSMATVTWFIYYWDKIRENRTTGSWLILGLLSGLMTLMRWQNCIFAWVLLVDIIESGIKSWQTKNFPAIRKLFLNVILYGTVVFISLLPQMVIWKILYGHYITIPFGSGYMFWKYPMIVETLWSSRNGLFSWAPLILFGFIGFIFFYQRNRRVTIYLLITFLIMLYINSCVADWWGVSG
ncbi:MAG: glycosyltransferase family 39 protein, partial [bacterium]